MYYNERIVNCFWLLQLLGVAIRAGIPFGLDLASVFWKNLVGLKLDPVVDLQESDIVTYAYIKKIEIVLFTFHLIIIIYFIL